jgi:hypothetical protein
MNPGQQQSVDVIPVPVLFQRHTEVGFIFFQTANIFA